MYQDKVSLEDAQRDMLAIIDALETLIPNESKEELASARKDAQAGWVLHAFEQVCWLIGLQRPPFTITAEFWYLLWGWWIAAGRFPEHDFNGDSIRVIMLEFIRLIPLEDRYASREIARIHDTVYLRGVLYDVLDAHQDVLRDEAVFAVERSMDMDYLEWAIPELIEQFQIAGYKPHPDYLDKLEDLTIVVREGDVYSPDDVLELSECLGIIDGFRGIVPLDGPAVFRHSLFPKPNPKKPRSDWQQDPALCQKLNGMFVRLIDGLPAEFNEYSRELFSAALPGCYYDWLYPWLLDHVLCSNATLSEAQYEELLVLGRELFPGTGICSDRTQRKLVTIFKELVSPRKRELD